ncbi:alpha/beta hydrolase [Sphingomonas sp. 28-63-12]|uniref:alpha/beta hydrolase n=1 Tax=Sphingomonas sp. 28-63-12 TaxID=1970434 RepID=UPI000BD4521A|nr:MAG: alpha/beta hydrolase [Sphingomonas sp. 28-63-12]
MNRGYALLGALMLAAAPVAALADQPVTELSAPGPLAPLHGGLLDAGRGQPVVLIVPGSGPTDRDGNSPLGVKAASYRLLAEGLAARGISTVRIDKRGMFSSKAAIADANKVTIADYAADVRAWVQATRNATGARCVWLLGHSEGGLVVLATPDASDICGRILVSAAGRPFGTLIHDQIHANPANAVIFDQADAALAKLETGEHVDTAGMHPGLMGLFAPAVQDYLIDLMRYQPAELAAKSTSPLLILQGENDIQIGVADARLLAAGRSDARLVLLSGVNHVLKTVGDADRAANAASYANPDLPIDPGVIAAIAAFVEAKR